MIEQILAKIDALTLWDIAWLAVGALGSLLFFLRWPMMVSLTVIIISVICVVLSMIRKEEEKNG